MDGKIGVYSSVSNTDSYLSFTQIVKEFMLNFAILHHWKYFQLANLSQGFISAIMEGKFK